MWKGRMYDILLLGSVLVCVVRASSSQLDDLVEEVWRWRLAEAPEFATAVGHHEYNDKLEQFTLDAFERRRIKYTEFIGKIDAFDRSSLASADEVTLDMLRDGLQRYVDGFQWRNYGMMTPINFLEGIHLDFSNMVEITPFKSEDDFKNYISRLTAVKERINQMIALMRISIQMNTTNHRVSIERVPGQIAKFYTDQDPVSLNLYAPFNDSLAALSISEPTKTGLRAEGLRVLRDIVIPAYRNLSSFIKQEYLPRTRASVGVASLPDGRAYYQACLRWHLTAVMTPEQVHSIGLREVARIQAEMEKIKSNQRFSGTLKEFISSLTRDPRHFYNTEEEILQGYRDIIANRSNPKLSVVFRDYPDMPVEVRRTKSDGPGGMYTDPAEDGSRPGIFWANTRQPKSRAKFDMMSLTLHEVSPGHHLQASYALSANIAHFRRKQDYDKYFSVPFHFPFYTSFVEGWALYAEYLGEEMGVYKDEYERFGRLTSEIFRACRLVVDTGLHVKGWGRQQAIDYMANYITDPISQIEVEIDRYITWPGQACAYKIGELKIKELRSKAVKELGSQFDLKDFHNVILTEGAVPLNVLENTVNTFISKNKATSAGGKTRINPILLFSIASLLIYNLIAFI